jgi:hypothetical protein
MPKLYTVKKLLSLKNPIFLGVKKKSTYPLYN